ncbi:MAG: SdpI family protein [Promicromonosporaceae bacterium]|nr:SdpI family protein [Promicromonosporaceae bacterium]
MTEVDAGLLPLIVIQPLVLLLSGLICRRAASGRLGRNFMAGYRFRELLASDEAWAAGHAAAERPSWIGFVLTTACAVLGLARAPVLFAVELAVFVACLGWAILAAIRAAAPR